MKGRDRNMLKRLPRGIRFLKNKMLTMFKERHLGRLRYIYERNGSDSLIIVFSAFGETRQYNYMKTLAESKIDKMFILDSFGYRGSYYWYENGDDEPNRLVSSLIERVRGGGINASIQQVAARAEHAPSTTD